MEAVSLHRHSVNEREGIPQNFVVNLYTEFRVKRHNGYLMDEMAFKSREEVVGKRFLAVRSAGRLKLSKISEWEWLAGVIRAVSCRDSSSSDFSVSNFDISTCSFKKPSQTIGYYPPMTQG